jgi:hypothetical protein
MGTSRLAPGDAVAQATVTRFTGNQKDSFAATFKFRGTLQSRAEYNEGGQTTASVVNGRGGAILLPDGKVRRLPPHAALGMSPLVFPFFSDLGKITDSTVSLKFLGDREINGVRCYGITLARQPDPADPLAHALQLASPITVWLSSANALPVQIDYVRLAVDNPDVVMHISRSFSDYRVVNGITVAFLQRERLEGELAFQIQLTSVQFNVGLTDTDFNLPRF